MRGARYCALAAPRRAFGDWLGVKIFPALLLAASCGLVSCFRSGRRHWQTDFLKAQAEAKAKHKLLLARFHRLRLVRLVQAPGKEVFSQPEFADYAKEHLVLVTVDFPRAKPLTPEAASRTGRSRKNIGIQGFPTIVVLNGDGKPVGELGYGPAGRAPLSSELKKLPKS